MKKLIGILLVIPLLWANELPRLLSLQDGSELKVDGYINAWMGASNDYVLILRYESDRVDDIEYLRNKANAIWPAFRPVVESHGYDYAAIRAAKYSEDRRSSRAYTFVIYKDEQGVWNFLEDKPAVQTE